MTGKLFCSFILIGFLIQANEAKPSFFVIVDYIPKIISSAAEILKTVIHGAVEIKHYQNQTNIAVDAAQDTINKEITELDQLVQKSVDEAQEIGKNITSCVDEEFSELQHIDFGLIDECRSSKAVNHLLVDIMALAKEEMSLAIQVSHCIFRHPILGSKLKICFDKEIQDIDNKIWKFKNEVETTIKEAHEKSSTCIKNDLEHIHDEIENVTETFESCTQDWFSGVMKQL